MVTLKKKSKTRTCPIPNQTLLLSCRKLSSLNSRHNLLPKAKKEKKIEKKLYQTMPYAPRPIG